jgi:hypothetical protein
VPNAKLQNDELPARLHRRSRFCEGNWSLKDGFVEDHEKDLPRLVFEGGPISIAVAADAWQFYGGGVFDDECGVTFH